MKYYLTTPIYYVNAAPHIGHAYTTIDRFQRTTSQNHVAQVQELFRRCLENGYIYKGSYTGQYCVFDELYVNDASPGDPCPECGRTTETVSEENYYFKLSAFQQKLL